MERVCWWTIEPSRVAEVVEKHGKLVVGDLGELMVEFESETQVSDLSQDLSQNFKDQVLIAP
jgi:hypothetical protein